MKTRTPISTISYNTQPFLAYTLAELKATKKILDAHWIQHEPDVDEPDYIHSHLRIEPDGTIDTNNLDEYFIEENSECPYMPLKCSSWRKSSFADWYLYCCHNPGYLRKKNLTRERREYHLSDFQSTSLTTLRIQISTEINFAKYGITETSSESAKDIIINAANNAESLSTALLNPQVKIHANAQNYLQVYLAARFDVIAVSLLASHGITPEHPEFLEKKESLLKKIEGTAGRIDESLQSQAVQNELEALEFMRHHKARAQCDKYYRELEEQYPF